MTSDDHNVDELIAALRQPALPAERAGEQVAITAMRDALDAAAPAAVAARTPHRGRRTAIAAVTIASLGVGGLVAAGPGGFFSPATDDSTVPDETNTESDSSSTSDVGVTQPGTTVATDGECAENHGAQVSSSAQQPGNNAAAAHDRCTPPAGNGNTGPVAPGTATTGDDATTQGGNSGVGGGNGGGNGTGNEGNGVGPDTTNPVPNGGNGNGNGNGNNGVGNGNGGGNGTGNEGNGVGPDATNPNANGGNGNGNNGVGNGNGNNGNGNNGVGNGNGGGNGTGNEGNGVGPDATNPNANGGNGNGGNGNGNTKP